MSWLLLSLLSCSEYGYSDSRWSDVFQQDRANEVDLLVVIDNSCSMVEEQENLARNFDALLQQFVEAEVDWRIAVTTTDVEEDRFRGKLQGGDDEIILTGPSGEIDRVEYNRSWGFTDGIALALEGQLLTAQSNDQSINWCPSTATFGDGQRGTPGVRNLGCDGSEPNPLFPGVDDGPRPPVQGELVITEILAQSNDDDRRCEWFEISSTSTHTLELGQVELSDRGQNLVTLPERTIAPYETFVIGRSDDACGAPIDIAFAEGFSLNDDLRYIDGSHPDASDLFAEAVAQGTIGSGIELGFEAAKLVFEEPYYTNDNDAWLRPEAKLALLFVSDEDDLSPLPVDGYLDFFAAQKGLRGYRDPQMVTVSAVVGVDRPPSLDAPACISDDGLGFYGERYLAAVNRTGGLADSICTEDFAPIVSRLGLTLSGLTLDFGLSRRPVLDTLEVAVYETEDTDSLIAELVIGDDYTYSIDDNALIFTVDQAPLAATFIVATYQILPEGAEILSPDDPEDPIDPGDLE